MGNEYEVYIWKNDKYESYHFCEDFLEALEAMLKAKEDGYKCIKLEWRP